MAKRAGVTKKVSLSVHKDDLAAVKARARRLHGGNVSAVFAELIADLKRAEAWARALDWYGEPIPMSDEDRERIDREIFGGALPSPKARRKRRAA
jgi:hypothetical protein